MLSPVYQRGRFLVWVWYLCFGIQLLLFSIACLINVVKGESGWWIFTFLTLSNGGKLAGLGLFVNIGLISWDVYTCNQMNKDIEGGLNKPNSFKEERALRNMKKYLKTIIILMIISIFAQMLYGIIGGLIGIGVLAGKYLFNKELKVLDKYKKGKD